MSAPTWARRDLTATLHAQGPLVTVEIPGIDEADMPRAPLLRGPGAVEIHELGPDGALDRRVLLDQAQIEDAAITSHITGDKLLGDLVVLEVDRSDLADLAEALDGDPLHGGTIVDAAYVPPTDRAPFAWGARRLAVTGGGHRVDRQPAPEGVRRASAA